jgi:predicted RNA-binding protein with PUA-like domain
MPNYWIFLTDPDSYHLDDLLKKKTEIWDGVGGTVAQKYLSELKKGDRIIGYHTAPGKCAYALLQAWSAPYQNPKLKEKNLVIDVCGLGKLPQPVPLAEMKASSKLKQMKLFKMFRPIAVSPLTPAEFREILRLGGLPSEKPEIQNKS